MGSNIKGITIEIGGDTRKLQDSLKDVNSKAKDIQGELRQVERLLKLDPSNTELLAQKQKLLTDAVSNTKDKLDTLKEAQRQVREQFEKGEIGEAQYNAIQREVIATEQELNKLEDKLKSINNKWDDTAKAFDNFGSKADEMGKKIAPISGVAAGIAGGMVAMAVKVGQSADDINTLSKQTGLATDTIQKFQLATDLIDVPLETMTGSLAKLTKNMGEAKNGSEKIQSAFDQLGVQILDNNGNLRDNEEVFYDLMSALGEISNETERDALAMQIFGKSAQDLNPLILGGADALKQLGKEAEDAGLILSQDALNSANAFNDEIDSLKATAAGTFSQLGMEILTVLLPILKELVEGAKDILSWVRTLDEGTIKIILTITGFIATLAPLLILIGKMATGISAVIKVVGLVTSGLSALGPVIAFLTGPVGLVILAITALIAIITALWTKNEKFREFIIGLWETIRDGTIEIVTAIGSFISESWTAISDAIRIILEVMSKIITDKFGFIWESIKLGFEAFRLLFEGDFAGFLEKLIQSALVWVTGWVDIGKDIVKGIWDGIKSMGDWIGKKISGFFTGIVDGAKDVLGIHSPSRVFADIIGKNMALGVGEGFTDQLQQVNDNISDGLDTTVDVAGSKTYNSKATNYFNIKAYVRSDNDVKKLAREIHQLQVGAERGLGVA